MVELTTELKQVIKGGKEYLQENNLNGFYGYLILNLVQSKIATVTKWFYSKGIDVLSYFKEQIPPYAVCRDAYEGEVVFIPYGIKEIGYSAFNENKSLKAVDIPDTLLVIGAFAFDETNIEEFVLPTSIVRVEQFAFPEGSKIICDPSTINWIGGYSRYEIEDTRA